MSGSILTSSPWNYFLISLGALKAPSPFNRFLILIVSWMCAAACPEDWFLFKPIQAFWTLPLVFVSRRSSFGFCRRSKWRATPRTTLQSRENIRCKTLHGVPYCTTQQRTIHNWIRKCATKHSTATCRRSSHTPIDLVFMFQLNILQ